ncbi:hybrid sensor histidine kinase/response regulator transcription factor [Bacteroides sp. 519]|uniref:hybrid sensor histidine kinase/response regulator transcription factor n=1 Tax=Bacteroides sp. 519 TaxID=2302937 RepID=UPI0013D1C563|nr:hybrid sensor histidine kinase/response regulator transcription factor [Bacteroides sp. 519]NDV59418.1 hybrid sensor histidine kinase/response regulator [Bacteroides sp. 519]
MPKTHFHFLFTLLLLLALPARSNQTGYYYFKQISVKDGLPSSVTCVHDDNNGLLWIGTTYGTYRFDGEKLKKYHQPGFGPIHSLYINAIEGDSNENIWVCTNEGVSRYNPETDTFEVLLNEGKPIQTYTVFSNKKNIIFPITDTLLVYKDLQQQASIPLQNNGKKTIILKMHEYNNQYYLGQSGGQLILIDKVTGQVKESPLADKRNIFDFYFDSQNCIWISEYGKGVSCYSPEGKLLDSFTTRNSGLSNDVVLDIEERNGQIWLATDGGGINIINPQNREITVLSNEVNPNFPANSVTFLQNGANNMWIGMVREGVLGMKENFITTYTKSPKNDPTGLSEKCPLFLLEDKDGIIWISTDGGGINSLDPKTDKFTHYPSTFGDKVVAICEFSDTELLASNYTKGFYLFNKKTGECRDFIIDNKETNERIKQSGPTNLYINSDGDIEILGGYYYRYSRTNKQFTQIQTPAGNFGGQWYYIGEYESNPYFHNQANIFFYDRKENTYKPVSIQKQRQILSAYISKTGKLWIASRNGLSTIDIKTAETNKITLPDANDIVTSLVMDHKGIMWMGTPGALYAYFVEEKRFIIFSETDGVLPNDFLPKPVLISRDDNVYMGGAMGLVRVNKPLNQRYETTEPNLSLLEIQLNGMNMLANRNNEIPQLKTASNFTSLVVRSKLDGADIFRKRIYRYWIEGLNSDFTQSSKPYLMIQTLPPGEYQIKAQCTQSDGLWGPWFDLLSLTVLPPWWQRPWFIILMSVIVLSVIAYALYWREKRMQQRLIERERQIYKEKVQALININHELRTPLTLLYTPLKQLMANKQIPYTIRGRLQNTFKQARQMRNIINMILNMRKMEVGQNTMHLTPTHFNQWLQSIVDDFMGEFEMRDIKLIYTPDPQIETVSFDTAQCEIIVSNLLMNAYKFSYPNSTVIVSTKLQENGSFVYVEVRDEGIGIANEKIDELFTRFQQGHHTIQGTGIGLSYAKQLVEMHGGKIGAMNNKDKGATFYFTLPYQQNATEVVLPQKAYLNEMLPTTVVSNVEGVAVEAQFHSVIIVEDDPDLRDYLAESLQPLFKTIYKAQDGLEAIPTIVSHLPQLVISDIVMPRMNGFELCRKIKQNPDLNYIPVILLTSQVEESSAETGYKTGADAYIPKPFDMDLLMLQINNILNSRNIVRQRSGAADITGNEQKTKTDNPHNEQFIIHLNKIIDENLSNTALDVNMVAQLMHMGRASLYNKMKTIIGIGVSEYINKRRIERAAQLLKDTEMTIREISEQTGFLHQRNFSTMFKGAMGDSPSEYRRK